MSRKKWLLGILISMTASLLGCIACFSISLNVGAPYATPTHESLALTGVKEILPPGGGPFSIGDWSPDGRSLVITYLQFPIPEAGWDSRIYILDINSGKKELIEETKRGGRKSVDWLPNQKIAFWATSDIRSGIWLMNADGRERQFLMEGETAKWSPDEKKVAFVQHNAIHLLDESGMDKVLLNNYPIQYGEPLAWSPDGQQLAITYKSQISILAIATGKLVQTTIEGNNSSPSWSPKGDMIAYVSDYHLKIVRSDGTCPIDPLPGVSYIYGAAWSPDGRWIAFEWWGGIYLLDVKEVLGDDFLETGPKCY